MKRGNKQDAIKYGKEALEFSKINPKAFYRLAQALKANGEFDEALAHMVSAIKLSPGDKLLRTEYKSLMDIKQAKEIEWRSKMSGFYNSKKMADLEEQDEEEALLKEKLAKKHFYQQDC